ncbi:MAG: hypothetical protein V7L03_11300 [Nostoc sp.]
MHIRVSKILVWLRLRDRADKIGLTAYQLKQWVIIKLPDSTTETSHHFYVVGLVSGGDRLG